MFNPVSLMLAAGIVTASLWPSPQVTQTDTSSYPIAAHGTLSIENASGDIKVQAWDGTTVKVVARRRAESNDVLANMHVQVTATGGSVTIKSIYPSHCRNCDITYDIQVPRSVGLTASDASGNVQVMGLSGLTDVETASGNIDVRRTSGMVDVSASSGNIVIGTASGPVRAKTASGNIDVNDASSSVDANASSGDVSVRCASVSNGSEIRLEAASGSVKLAIPRSTGATIAAQTDAGSIQSDFGQAPHAGYAGATLQQTIGDGRAKISLTAISGSIKLQAF